MPEPKRLSQFKTDRAILTEAEAVAQGFCDHPPISSSMCEFQGMFSKSAIVELSDSSKVVVQLRDNEIDTSTAALANALLGDIVPIPWGAVTKAYKAYVSRFVPGTVWALREHHDLSIEQAVHIAYQVGSLIARCEMNENSSGIVERYIIPRLQKILSKEEMPNALRSRIEALIPVAAGLKALPLFLAHADVNTMNIIIDDNETIMGLIDWEMAQLLPFGMNGWCIRHLSVVNRNRIDYVLEKTQPMAVAFWNGLVETMSARLGPLKDKIVDAMLVGMVLSEFPEGILLENKRLDVTLERIDWIETTFRPLCAV